MRVAVVGAGSMGSLFGAAFQDAGNDTFLVETNERTVSAIRDHGLIVERRDGRIETYSMQVTADPVDIGMTVDLIVVQVKGFATSSAADLIRPIVGPETAILTLQNGLGNEEVLREKFPDNQILIGNSIHSVLAISPGRIHHTGVRPTYLGPAAQAWQSAADRAAQALTGSGFEVHVLAEPEIRVQLWAKFVTNCASLPTSALSGLATAKFNEQESLLRLSDDIVRETCEIARAVGVTVDVEDRVAFNRELFRTSGGKPSMLQDIEARRRTEIDTINGAAVRLAEQHGAPAPLNSAMVALVKAREIALGVG